ncbi:MAG: hypothetical protein O7D30_01495 [Rickettsia endosymbiont of Ixodes persulcatus]|nr:hypothetical protein [Rickettsia endosymbiont of Ixodes persulcatus]
MATTSRLKWFTVQAEENKGAKNIKAGVFLLVFPDFLHRKASIKGPKKMDINRPSNNLKANR